MIRFAMLHTLARSAPRTARSALLGCLLAGCSGEPRGKGSSAAPETADTSLFSRLPGSRTGITFANVVQDSRETNVFTYRNHYNGGGVGIADLNGDSLPEVVLTSNEEGARLYLNLGGFAFRDVTGPSGLAPNGSWTTGVAMADVDGNGWVDLYICHAGKANGRANQLFLNLGPDATGVPRFEERAAEWGVRDGGYSTHAAFLDFDRDGDLDLYVLNNSPRAVSSFGLTNTRNVRHREGGDRLYRNDGSRFTDVTVAAGILSPEVAFGLGVGVGDVNRDGWPDLYVANDFFERDYLYLNSRDGTFREVLAQAMPQVSYFSMGMDIADVDNDGWPDIYTTDMLPRDEYRLRTTSMFEGWNLYQAKLQNGYHYQFMRNMLQRNNADGSFTDVGQLAGVAQTDWSWSALLADLDLDGWKDIYVTNGLARDVTSQDYVTSLANQAAAEAVFRGDKVDFLKLVEAMSSTKIADYAFRNAGDGSFTDATSAWGLGTPSFSNGAAYGDLDGDGALDLVVNNVNDEAFVYRNNARRLYPGRRFLQVRLVGMGRNRLGIGARVTVWRGPTQQVQEVYPVRGFQSSVDPVLTFGLDTARAADSVEVLWPDGRRSLSRAVAGDARLVLRQSEAEAAVLEGRPAAEPTPLLAPAVASIPWRHRENDFVDFDRERLIPRMVSTDGPAFAVADVNGDGLDDVFLGGAKEQPGALWLRERGGGWRASSAATFLPDSVAEDVAATFFDANGDGAPDLYVVSGGNEFSEGAPALQDRLYLNDGRGGFVRARGAVPPEAHAGGTVAAADYDGDGDQDLFVGSRLVPWGYGRLPTSMLLRNDGRGRFTDVTAEAAPGLVGAGMVTDAAWADADGDGRLDLVVVGDWMPIVIFRNVGRGRLERMATRGLEATGGWWNRVLAADFTGDGSVDLVVGNFGRNNVLRATAEEPLSLLVKDFDRNGADDQVMAMYSDGRQYPFVMRDDLIRGIPPLKARYFRYEDYARATLDSVFPAPDRNGAIEHRAHTLASVFVRNVGGGTFTVEPLPAEAQLAPVFGLAAGDVDGDGALDVLLGGNFDGLPTQLGRMAGSRGLLLRGDGRGTFAAVQASTSGLRVAGQVRGIAALRGPRGREWLFVRNNESPLGMEAGRRSGGGGRQAAARAAEKDR